MEKQIGYHSCKIHDAEKIFIASIGDERCPKCWMEEKNKEMKMNAAKAAHAALNLPRRLSAMSFDNYQQVSKGAEKALATCREFARSMTGGLIMIGSVGTGKTHLAVAICKAFCDAGKPAKISTIPEIIRDVRSTWGKGKVDQWGCAVSEEDVIEKYSSVHLLVIDEVGGQYGTDSERVTITEIINNRYNRELPTVLIGNVTLSQAVEYLGERVVDRVRHGGSVVVFDWPSHRKNGGYNADAA